MLSGTNQIYLWYTVYQACSKRAFLGMVNHRNANTHYFDSNTQFTRRGNSPQSLTSLAVVYAGDYRIKRRPLRDGGQSCIYRKSFWRWHALSL